MPKSGVKLKHSCGQIIKKESHQLQLFINNIPIVIDFREQKAAVTPVLIKDEAVEVVFSCKYLVDNRLDWKENTSSIFKRSRLFLP